MVTLPFSSKVVTLPCPYAKGVVVSEHPLSIQLYTVRNAIGEDLGAALKRVAGLGFTTVELYDFVERADEYARLLAENGLRPSSAHVHLVGADLDVVFAAAKTVGVTTIIEPLVVPERWTMIGDITDTANALNHASSLAAKEGLTVGYHNHAWELENSFDGTSALEVFEALLDPAVVLEVDTYWATVGGADTAALLTRLGDRVKFLHVKDGDISKVDKNQKPAGSGRVPVLKILAAAPNAVRVVEFDDFDGDVFDGIAHSIAFLTANGEKL